ncbi:MAG: HAD hydrolase-like protein [Gorillibacterium sp.]|nr:HAD hydrolase-like protein [Gorillibacterium sp.]
MTEPRSKPEAMIFDMDGTLFKTESIILPAFYQVCDDLRREGMYKGDNPPDHLILGGLGKLLAEIWHEVFPNETLETHRRADELLLKHQIACLERGEGELYPNVEATLKKLQELGIRLFVASNGLEDYVKLVAHHKGLAEYFENLYSAGEYQTQSKVELVRMLLERYSLSNAWMVGDRSSDVEAGKKNGLLVVGCAYAGFSKDGELDGSDMRIGEFRELLKLLPHSTS